MAGVRLSPKLLRTLQTHKQSPISASASAIGGKSTATTSQSKSVPKPVSALEEKLLFQIRATQLPEPVREFKFHHARRWRADFCWPDARLMVEVEGGHWTGGKHTRGSGFDSDCEKYAEAALAGWRVIRCTGTHIKSGEALEWIRRALA